MTEEIEKQAEEYLENIECCECYPHEEIKGVMITLYDDDQIKQAFQDGAKWGMEHAIEWHEIKRRSKDLPPRSEDNDLHSVFVSNEYGEPIYYNYFTAEWYDVEGDEVSEIYKYWCELPTYKE